LLWFQENVPKHGFLPLGLSIWQLASGDRYPAARSILIPHPSDDASDDGGKKADHAQHPQQKFQGRRQIGGQKKDRQGDENYRPGAG